MSFAVQTLSASVATAIEFCREELKLSDFKGSEATCTFIKWFDEMFDLCNSKSPIAKGYKSPITISNRDYKIKRMEMAATYITSLEVRD